MNERDNRHSELIKAEAIQDVLVQQLMYGVAVLQDEVHKFVNKAMEVITGYSKEELIGESYLNIVAPESVLEAKKQYRENMEGIVSPVSAGIRFMCKDGSIKDIEIYADLIEFEGRPAILSVVQDISTRKKAEEALRESEERFLAFMHHFPGIAFMRDAKGSFLYMNAEFESLTSGNGDGSTAQRAHNQRSEQDFDCFTHIDNSVLKRCKTIKTIERINQKDGVHYWLMYRFPITDGVEKASTIGGIGMDITERRRMEIELKKSRERLSNLVANLHKVREDLSAQVAQEIHDELGQVLTAMKFDLSWLDERMPADSPILHDMVAQISRDIDQAIKSVGRIASELRPRLLDELGLTSAVRWYTEEFQKRTGIKCKVEIVPEEIMLNRTMSTVVFRILQEALTNIARHSEAQNVDINLKQWNNSLVLRVVDDGIGITNKQINRSDAFGLMGMKERAYSVGGVVRINGTNNKGTKITVKIPIE